MARAGRSGWIDSSENVRPKYPRYLYPSDPIEEYGAFRVQASNNIEQVVPSPRKKLEGKRKLVKKYRRLDDAEDQRGLDNVVRVSVPRDKENLMDDISWYRNWVPTSLGSYEESLEMRRMQRRLDQTSGDFVTAGLGPAKQEPWRPMPRHTQPVNRRNDKPWTGEGSRRRNNNKDIKPMIGTLKQKSQRQNKGRRNKFSRKQFGVKKSQESKKLMAGVKPPRPPHAPPPPVVTPLLDHMEAPGVRPVSHDDDEDDAETTKKTNSQQEPSIEQNAESEKVNSDNHEAVQTNYDETNANLVTSVHEQADKDENFDINIDNQQFSVNPVITYDEREMLKEIQNTIKVDRLPGVGQIVTNDLTDHSVSPLLPTRRPRRLVPKPTRPSVTTSRPPLPTSSWRSPTAVGGSLNRNQGQRFSPTPLASSLSNPNKRKKFGAQYSSDSFDEDIHASALKRRIGPQIPIMTSRMDINKEGTYNFE